MTKTEHRVWFDPHGPNGPTAHCLCGWSFWHRRPKVIDRAANRHLDKKGQR